MTHRPTLSLLAAPARHLFLTGKGRDHAAPESRPSGAAWSCFPGSHRR